MQVTEKPLAIASQEPSSAKPRLDWVDNLRTLMILLVVNMHACVTYTYVGSWYYMSPPEPSIQVKIPFVFWQAHLQSFFMGLLFFIAGYYADRSLTNRGPGSFMKERLRRLGIPVLLYMLLIHPFIIIVLHPGYDSPGLAYYAKFITTGRFIGSSGPMWFAFALLIFSAIYAAVAKYIPEARKAQHRLIGGAAIWLGIALALLSFLVRTVQPIGTDVINFQLCYFAQYVVVFGLGIWTSRRDGLNAIAASPVAKRAGIAALVFGPLALLGILIASLPLPVTRPLPFEGGWNPLALAYACWEQMTGVALGLGAMALCARKLNVRTKLSAWLSDRSFAVYMLHPPVLIAITLWLQPIRTTPFLMVPIVTLLALTASFLLADLAKRTPLRLIL